MQEMQVQSLGLEDPLEEGMATNSSIPAWRILWTDEPGGLYIVHRVGCDWAHIHPYPARYLKLWSRKQIALVNSGNNAKVLPRLFFYVCSFKYTLDQKVKQKIKTVPSYSINNFFVEEKAYIH